MQIDANVRTLQIKEQQIKDIAAFQSKIGSRLSWAIYDGSSPPKKPWNDERDVVSERMRRMKMSRGCNCDNDLG